MAEETSRPYSTVGQYVRAKFPSQAWRLFWLAVLIVPAKAAMQAQYSGWSIKLMGSALLAIPVGWLLMSAITVLALAIGGFVTVHADRLPPFLRRLHALKVWD